MSQRDGYRLFDGSVRDFDQLRRQFRWHIPKQLNVASACLTQNRDRRDQIAVFYEHHEGATRTLTFGDLGHYSDRLANALRVQGIERDDRVALLLPQRPEVPITHFAVFKLGALTVPLSVLFGPDALLHRLNDSGAKVLITDAVRADLVQELRPDLPELRTILSCDDRGGDRRLWDQIAIAGNVFEPAVTQADDPALLIYTSGTTGAPKGALIPHRALLGNLSGFELSHDFLPQDGDFFWTPADWAWTGGLWDALIPSLYYGVAILGFEGVSFDPERACALMGKYRVRNAFLPPTAMKMLRQVPDIRGRYGVALRSIMSAGEQVAPQIVSWAQEALQVTVNEMWGQTEVNYLVGNCQAIMPVRPGSMGKPYPGHEVRVIDDHDRECPADELGELALRRGDPVMTLGYWGNPQATRRKLEGEWFRTGDMGRRDEDGYLWFVGRSDDVISSAGYRIGPGEIEDCLLKHPAVAQAAVIGKPDELRGNIVKAFVVLAAGYSPGPELAQEIQTSVRTRLAAYEYPREVEFLEALPLTTTGKVRRVDLRRREAEKKSPHHD